MSQTARFAIYNYRNDTYYRGDGLWSRLQEEAFSYASREKAQPIARLLTQTQEPVRIVEI